MYISTIFPYKPCSSTTEMHVTGTNNTDHNSCKIAIATFRSAASVHESKSAWLLVITSKRTYSHYNASASSYHAHCRYFSHAILYLTCHQAMSIWQGLTDRRRLVEWSADRGLCVRKLYSLSETASCSATLFVQPQLPELAIPAAVNHFQAHQHFLQNRLSLSLLSGEPAFGLHCFFERYIV